MAKAFSPAMISAVVLLFVAGMIKKKLAGTFMLNQPVDEILYGEDGKAMGIRSGEQTARAPVILCDPSYAPHKVRSTGKVVRSICILNHSIPNTKDVPSCQIIIPQKQCNRNNDVYISCISSTHSVCADGYFIAICSTQVETDTPEAELQAAFNLIGDVQVSFTKVYDTFEPVDDGREDNVIISKSYDATSHFESACEDVLSLYERLMGEPLNYDEPLRPFTQNAGVANE